MTKSRGILPPRRPWTWVEIELIKWGYADSLTADLAKVLGRSEMQVHRKARKLGLKKDREWIVETARKRSSDPAHPMRAAGFKKGHVPANKGVRRPEGWSPGRMAETQFRKGQMPHTTMPLGSYRINGDGYLEVKFSEDPGPYFKRWKPVHRKLWEEAYGPIPEGHKVALRPGRKTTVPEEITLDALELLSHAEMLARNSIHNLPQPLAEVTRLRALVTRAINKRTKDLT